MMLHYQIEFDDYRQHLAHVTARFRSEPYTSAFFAYLDTGKLPDSRIFKAY